MKSRALWVVAFLLSFRCAADVVILSRGQVLSGDVLKQNDDGVVIKMDSGTLSFSQSSVKDVRLTSTDGAGHALDLPETNRIPSWGKIVSAISKPAWASDLRQIPATVIDNGVLENVPYVSFHCAGDCYELNIYGDPDNPAGVEIGALKNLVNNDRSRSNCVAFISSILSDWGDKRIARDLARTKEIVTNEDLTFEITLPDEPDSYGGWWISVYNEPALEKARASGKELLTITEPAIIPKSNPIADSTQQFDPGSDQASPDAWSASELSRARMPAADKSPSGPRVFVRSYYRRDGTYVSSYTRNAPHRR